MAIGGSTKNSALRWKCCSGNFDFLRSRRRYAVIVKHLRISAALATIPHLYSSIPFSGRFQVVFRASFVSRREAIIDLYAAMLKDMGVALDAESPAVRSPLF